VCAFAFVIHLTFPYYLPTNDIHTAGKAGPPLELGWEYKLAEEIRAISAPESTETTAGVSSSHSATAEGESPDNSVKLNDQGRISVDVYETIRPSVHRRRIKTLYLKASLRTAKLREWEVTDQQMQRAIRMKKGIRACRRNTNVSLNPLHKYCKLTERALRVRKLRRALRILGQINQAEQEVSHERLYPKGMLRAF